MIKFNWGTYGTMFKNWYLININSLYRKRYSLFYNG